MLHRPPPICETDSSRRAQRRLLSTPFPLTLPNLYVTVQNDDGGLASARPGGKPARGPRPLCRLLSRDQPHSQGRPGHPAALFAHLLDHHFRKIHTAGANFPPVGEICPVLPEVQT